MICTRPETIDDVSRVFQAFADPTRLRILSLLRGRELCVGDIVNTLQVPQPTASRHLGALRESGLVTCRGVGTWRHYALTSARNGFHRMILDCLTRCSGNVPAFREDRRRLADLRRSGGCCPR
jgi:ArsR family transcriptional regulator